MKLTQRIVVLLACTTVGAGFVACNGDDEKEDDPGTNDVNSMGGGQMDGATDGTDPDDPDDPAPTGPQCDEPGGSQCTGSASGIVCAEDSTDGVTFVCASGEECSDGACVGICEPGATQCVENAVLRVCTDDGRSWVNIPCQDGSVCDPELGACGLGGGLVCTPGETECNENGELATCNEDGSAWDAEACPGATACEDGACMGSVCQVGATRCDSTATDVEGFFEGSRWFIPRTEPNFGVIQRCVDGESWQTEACPSDGETQQFCTYTNTDRVEVARFRGEVNQWIDDMWAWDEAMSDWDESGGTQPTRPPAPDAMELPADATAACVAVPDQCDMYQAFFESPADTRQCADPSDINEGEAWWDGYTECAGLVPFSPITVETTECAGASACGTWEPQSGCEPTRCNPGEVQCNGENEYQVCFFEFGAWTPDSVGFDRNTFECADDPSMGGVAPGMCEDFGMSPNRSVECSGTPVEPDLTEFTGPRIVEVVPTR